MFIESNCDQIHRRASWWTRIELETRGNWSSIIESAVLCRRLKNHWAGDKPFVHGEFRYSKISFEINSNFPPQVIMIFFFVLTPAQAIPFEQAWPTNETLCSILLFLQNSVNLFDENGGHLSVRIYEGKLKSMIWTIHFEFTWRHHLLFSITWEAVEIPNNDQRIWYIFSIIFADISQTPWPEVQAICLHQNPRLYY